MALFEEIRRRNVHRVALAYVAGAWLIVQVAETMLPVFGLEPEALRIVVIKEDLSHIDFNPPLPPEVIAEVERMRAERARVGEGS